jgi:dolichol kinase
MAMPPSLKHSLAIVLAVAFAGSIAFSLFQIFAGLLFFGYSGWFYVPPICTLAIVSVVAIERRGFRIAVAYTILAIFLLSYVMGNWRDVETAIQESFWLLLPDLLQVTLCLAALAFVHLRR